VQKKLGTHTEVKIGLCPAEVRRRDVNYSLLDEEGAVRPRIDGQSVYVQKGDVIIGKYLKKADKEGNEEISDCSLVVKHGEEGYIDRVYKSVTPDGWDMVRVVIRTTRFPRAGDKVAARSGQKGTIGIVLRQEDMPFTRDGIIPDLILNPLALPSRMTVNQILESALGKICVTTGENGDATAYAVEEDYAQKIHNRLKDLGFDEWGNEHMMCGFTGEMLETKVFIGPTYYQRLKHLVDDKIHARARGKVTKLYRQAPDGRGVGGGLRLGEINRSQWRYSRRC
jgi:DNA-directed RNA polymerase II subunit RPB2